jgi:hypothetical protein
MEIKGTALNQLLSAVLLRFINQIEKKGKTRLTTLT